MTQASNSNIMVTRCPKCNTAFRITAVQLESAKGAVRCGSCLHIFKAQSHLVQKPEPKTPTQIKTTTPSKIDSTTKVKSNSISPPTKPTIKKTLNPIVGEDDLLISDDMEEKAAGKSKYDFDGYMDIDLETKTNANSLFERKIKETPEEEIRDTADESWAENLMDDDEEEVPQIGLVKKTTPSSVNNPVISPEMIQQAADEKHPVFSFIDEEPKEDSPHSSSDPFAFSDEFNKLSNTQGSSFGGNRELSEEKEEIINAIPVAGIFHDDDFQDYENKRQLKIEPKIRSYNGSRKGLLKNIIPAPLELAANNISYWYNRVLWPTLALLSFVALILQIAYFRFDHFARIQPYRDWYAMACPIFGCKLPTLIDKTQIKTRDLVVRPLEENPDALLVEVNLVNQAAFDQPFPDLLLSFSDMDGNVKASRRFTPADYLGGELSGKTIMPSKQPIYLTLEIKDPKLDNYKMDVL